MTTYRHFKRQRSELQEHTKLDELRTGLLELINSALVNLADIVIDSVLGEILKFEYFLCFVNYPLARVRTLSVQVRFFLFGNRVHHHHHLHHHLHHHNHLHHHRRRPRDHHQFSHWDRHQFNDWDRIVINLTIGIIIIIIINFTIGIVMIIIINLTIGIVMIIIINLTIGKHSH